jgi:hypothetical protein
MSASPAKLQFGKYSACQIVDVISDQSVTQEKLEVEFIFSLGRV